MENRISRESTVAAAERQLSSDFLEDEIVVLDMEEGAYYLLNPVGARIWSMIQEPTSVADLVEELLEEYEVEPAVCAEEVIALLDDLADRELIHVDRQPD